MRKRTFGELDLTTLTDHRPTDFTPKDPVPLVPRQTSWELWQRHCTRLTEDVPTLSNEPSISLILPKAQPPSCLTSMELNHHTDTSLHFCFFQLLFCPKQIIFLIFPQKDHKDQCIQLRPVHTKPVTYGLIFRVLIFLLPIREDDKQILQYIFMLHIEHFIFFPFISLGVTLVD